MILNTTNNKRRGITSDHVELYDLCTTDCKGQGSYFCSGIDDFRCTIEKLRTQNASVTPLTPIKSISLYRKQQKRTLKIVVRMLKCSTKGFCQWADGDDSVFVKGLRVWPLSSQCMCNTNWTCVLFFLSSVFPWWGGHKGGMWIWEEWEVSVMWAYDVKLLNNQ